MNIINSSLLKRVATFFWEKHFKEKYPDWTVGEENGEVMWQIRDFINEIEVKPKVVHGVNCKVYVHKGNENYPLHRYDDHSSITYRDSIFYCRCHEVIERFS